jgi:septum formation protein
VSGLILASASPRRAELLRGAGVEFHVHAVDCDESWRVGETPLAYVARVALGKALLAARVPTLPSGALILAADTTVWLDEHSEPLAKPRDRAHASEMLRALTGGRAHAVSTACAFARVGQTEHAIATLTETTRVYMRRFSEPAFARFIGPYLDAGDWTDKAGAYAIQGRAAAIVERIEGSYTNVVGLPLAQVVATLEELT